MIMLAMNTWLNSNDQKDSFVKNVNMTIAVKENLNGLVSVLNVAIKLPQPVAHFFTS
jgi:hypothetical protein